MGPRYGLTCYWGPRAESTNIVADRFLGMLQELSRIDPAFGNWHLIADEGIELAPMSRADLVHFIDDSVKRADDGTPSPKDGYHFGVLNTLLRFPRQIGIDIRTGSSIVGNYFINTVDVETQPLDDENASLISCETFTQAVLAVTTAWEATWCAAYPYTLLSPQRGSRPEFYMGWMTYLSARFAPMVTPPLSATAQRLPDGALLMIATKERFDTNNPTHLAAARDIAAAIAPVNALPWPPEYAFGT